MYRGRIGYPHSLCFISQMSQALDKAQNPSLELSPMSSPYSDVKAYIQGNTLASRKKVLPIIKDFLKSWEKRIAPSGNLDDFGDLEGVCCPGMEEGGQYHSHRCTEDSGMEEDSNVPPTPMNSLVEGCPLDDGLPRISEEAITEKFSKMASQEDPEDETTGGL